MSVYYLLSKINKLNSYFIKVEMSGITRPMSQMRKLETKEALFRVRKRTLKYLVHSFLKQEGFLATAECLTEEAHLTGEYQVCDNIDLDIILQDYCSYYLQRFNKPPQFCRKVELEAPRRPPPSGRPARRTPPAPIPIHEEEKDNGLPGCYTVVQCGKEEVSTLPPIEQKPLSLFLSNASSDKKELAETLYQCIIRPSGVTWSDVKGLEMAKSLLMESVVYPVRHPELFTGLLTPWRGVLLHGPPGTGKTFLAKVVAADTQCTFFNIACSTIVNKWRGESEKIVKVLFEMASYYAPSIIFIDEVETIASDRSLPGEHEASRRLKAQLLTELDGVTETDGIFLLANSNMPWEIDPAMLRRLEKRIFIPLPDLTTRAELFQTFLGTKVAGLKVDFEELARRTEGYSGSDIKLVCKEALMTGVRKMLPNMNAKGKDAIPNIGNQQGKDKLKLGDILTAIEKTKPVSKNLTQKHSEWQSEMGCS